MNKRKVGGRYRYPDSLFLWFLPLTQPLDMRSVKGMLRALFERYPGLPVPDYTTIWRWIQKFDFEVPEIDTPEDVYAYYDTTGIKFASYGEWMRHKWKRYRGWLKVGLIMVHDPLTNRKHIVSITVEDESVSDHRKLHYCFRKVPEDIVSNLKRFYSDGSLDTRGGYNVLYRHHIIPVIKVRKNASTLAHGCPYRAG